MGIFFSHRARASTRPDVRVPTSEQRSEKILSNICRSLLSTKLEPPHISSAITYRESFGESFPFRVVDSSRQFFGEAQGCLTKTEPVYRYRVPQRRRYISLGRCDLFR